MKKNLESSKLAAKLAAAASQPAGTGAVPTSTAGPAVSTVKPAAEPASALAHSKAKAAKAKSPDTVPITLRPSGDLLNKFVLKAAERTREEGRVVSAQQIMIEALERSAP